MARIEIDHLTKMFGSRIALEDVSLSLEKGQIVGLLGPNGSGKTTLIKTLNGLLSPTHGGVRINDMAPGVETKRRVAYLPDRTALPEYMTTLQLMQLYSPNPCYIDFEELVRNGIDAVELTNCGAFRDSLDIWDCNCILVMNPEIIVPE